CIGTARWPGTCSRISPSSRPTVPTTSSGWSRWTRRTTGPSLWRRRR
ncbi:MAG: hypothetical protein AVDCRST_MAG12-938, partial [uncultured Rubrobacteraceae bacterium]